jgi:predicted phosphodiesterase
VTALRLGILTDSHRTVVTGERGGWHNPYDFDGVSGRFERALRWLDRESVDVIAMCGDLTHRGDREAMRAVLEQCLRVSRRPLVAVSGNHDVARGQDVLANTIGHLDRSGLALARPEGDVVRGVRVAGLQLAPGSGWFGSRLREPPAVAAWGDEPIVMLSHFPILSRAAALATLGMPYPGDIIDRADVAAPVLARVAPTVVLSGHIHARDAHAEGPVLQLTQGALVEPPFDAAVVTVDVDAAGVSVTRRIDRTDDRRAEYEPTLVGGWGSWRYADGRWWEVHANGRSAAGSVDAMSGS